MGLKGFDIMGTIAFRGCWLSLFAALLSALAGVYEPTFAHERAADFKRLDGLIEKLGSASFEEREAASRAVVKMGAAALSVLRRTAETHKDPEVRARAKVAVTAILRAHEIARYIGPKKRVCSMAFSPDRRRVLSVDYYLGNGNEEVDGVLRLWELETGKEVRRMAGHARTEGAGFSPDGNWGFSTGWGGHPWERTDDYSVRLWDLKTGSERRRFVGHSSMVNAAALSPNNRRLVSTGCDYTIRIWDVESQKELHRLELGKGRYTYQVLLSPDGRRVYLASGTVSCWDVETGRELLSLKANTNLGCGIALAPEGRLILASGADRSIRLFDTRTGKELGRFEGHLGSGYYPYRLVFSPDGRRVLSAGNDSMVRLWDVESRKELACFQTNFQWILCVAFSPDGREAYAGFPDNTVQKWRLPE